MRMRFCRATNVKPVPKLQQERFQMLDQGVFQVALAVFVLEVQELQQVRVADFVLDRRRRLPGLGLWPRASMAACCLECGVRSKNCVLICRSSCRTDQPPRMASAS